VVIWRTVFFVKGTTSIATSSSFNVTLMFVVLFNELNNPGCGVGVVGTSPFLWTTPLLRWTTHTLLGLGLPSKVGNSPSRLTSGSTKPPYLLITTKGASSGSEQPGDYVLAFSKLESDPRKEFISLNLTGLSLGVLVSSMNRCNLNFYSPSNWNYLPCII
jgi:hypothetical protein